MGKKSEFYQYFVFTKKYLKDLCHFLLNFSAGIFQIESRKLHQLKVSLALIWGLKNGSFLLFSKIPVQVEIAIFSRIFTPKKD